LIHFVWTDEPLPDWAQANIDEFARLNPREQIVVHTDSARLRAKYRETYDVSTVHMQRSDWLRASILQDDGGWYFDCDCWPVKPLPAMDVGDKLACLCWDTGCLNAMMYCEPGCPVWDLYEAANPGDKLSGSHALNKIWLGRPDMFAPLDHSQWTGGRLDPINYDLAHTGQADTMMVPSNQVVIHGS